MKEIDFLPEWYKSCRRREISYRAQYIALAGILLLMMAWNFVVSNSVSKAAAEVSKDIEQKSKSESLSREVAGIKDEIAQLQKEANILERVDSRIDVASILAELSFLTDESIVLSKVEFKAENFVDDKLGSEFAVRSAKASKAAGKKLKTQDLIWDVRFKVVIGGVAADARNVAELICKLEDSPYFCLVCPSFSRSTEIKAIRTPAGTSPGEKKGDLVTQEELGVSEFEISCYLANYQNK